MIYRNTVAVAVAAILATAMKMHAAHAQEAPANDAGQDTSNQLEEVVVTGLRASLEQSMDLKRDAVGVVDAITAEDIGKFPDTNLAESLQRITGISIDRRNGEGSQVTARGFGPQFNLITLNGRQVPGADGFGNGDVTVGGSGSGTRSFNFAQLAAEAINGVEVYKTSRADLSTGGIGATVNIKTARPFDTEGTVMSLGGKGVYDDSSPFDNEVTPEVSGIFSYTNDDKTWGVGLNGSYQERHGGSVQSTVNAWNMRAWDGTDPAFLPNGGTNIQNAPAMGQLYGLPNDIRYAFSDFERERVNAQGVLQYAPMETVTLTLDYTMARNEISEDRGEQTTWLQRSNSFTNITFDTGAEAVATPTSLRDISGGTGGKDFGFEQQRNEQKNELDSIGFNAKWDVSDRFTLAFDAHNSEAKSLPNDPSVPGASATFFSFAGTNCQLDTCPGQWVQEFAFNNGLPISTRTFFPTTAAALANTGGSVNPDFTNNQLGSQILRVFSQQQTAEVQQARLDGSLDFDAVGLKLGSLDFNEGRLQFGVDTRTMEMTRRNTTGQATLGNWGGQDASGVPGMVALLTPFSLTGLFDDFSAAGAPSQAFRGNATTLAQWAFANGANPIDGRRYNQWDAASTSTPTGVLSADPAPDNDDFIEEEVSSLYVQWGMAGELGDMPTHLNVGVRYEQTDVTSTANITLPNAMIWQANNDFQIGRSNQVQEETVKADYDHVLPSLDFDLGLREDLKARFSYSTTIARANYNNLFAGAAPGGASGSILINPTTRAAAQAQNPSLVPLESDNIDVSLEWYFDRNGFVSAGFWNKNVDNFIGTTVNRSSLYNVTDPTAGPDAQAALAFLQSQACVNQVTAAGNAAQLSQHCSANDTALFTALAMMRRPDVAGGLNAYNGNQVIQMENAVDLTGDASRGDPLYQFDIQSPINQESARIYGWEMGGQYFFGDTGFGVQANYTIVNGDVEFDDTAPPGTNQFALLGLSDTANLVLMYEKFGFTTRLAYNWRDEFLFQTNQNGSNTNPIYIEAYDQFDLNVGYDWSNQLSFAFEVINLTGEDIRWHARAEKMLVRLEDQSPRYALGMRYKF